MRSNFNVYHLGAALLCGVAGGLAAGWGLGRLASRRHFDRELTIESNQLKDHYRAQIQRISRDRNHAYGLANAALGYSDPALDEDADDDPVIGTGISPAPAVAIDDSVAIHTISQLEFEEFVPGYEKAALIWYAEDCILSEDGEIQIRDVENTTGVISRERFGGVSGDPDVLYVRNNRLMIDYEISWDGGAYSDMVASYGHPGRAEE